MIMHIHIYFKMDAFDLCFEKTIKKKIKRLLLERALGIPANGGKGLINLSI